MKLYTPLSSLSVIPIFTKTYKWDLRIYFVVRVATISLVENMTPGFRNIAAIFNIIAEDMHARWVVLLLWRY